MIDDVRYEDFIGIYDTQYQTQPIIDYWEYQKKCGATFNRKGIFGKERRANQRKDQCLATEDFILDQNVMFMTTIKVKESPLVLVTF